MEQHTQSRALAALCDSRAGSASGTNCKHDRRCGKYKARQNRERVAEAHHGRERDKDEDLQ